MDVVQKLNISIHTQIYIGRNQLGGWAAANPFKTLQLCRSKVYACVSDMLQTRDKAPLKLFTTLGFTWLLTPNLTSLINTINLIPEGPTSQFFTGEEGDLSSTKL